MLTNTISVLYVMICHYTCTQFMLCSAFRRNLCPVEFTPNWQLDFSLALAQNIAFLQWSHCSVKNWGREKMAHISPGDIFKPISSNEKVKTSLRISQKFVPSVRVSNVPALVQIMAWRRPGDKPLYETTRVNHPTKWFRLRCLTPYGVTGPQFIKEPLP